MLGQYDIIDIGAYSQNFVFFIFILFSDEFATIISYFAILLFFIFHKYSAIVLDMIYVLKII